MFLYLSSSPLPRIYLSLPWCVSVTHQIDEHASWNHSDLWKMFGRRGSLVLNILPFKTPPKLLLKLSKCPRESCAAIQTWIANAFLAPFYPVAMHHLPKMISFSKARNGRLSLFFSFDTNFLLFLTHRAQKLLHVLPHYLSRQFSSRFLQFLVIRDQLTSFSETRQQVNGYRPSNPCFTSNTSSHSEISQQYDTSTGKGHNSEPFPVSVLLLVLRHPFKAPKNFSRAGYKNLIQRYQVFCYLHEFETYFIFSQRILLHHTHDPPTQHLFLVFNRHHHIF